MWKQILLGMFLLGLFKGVVSIEDKKTAEQNETLIQEIIVRTKSAGSSGMSKELEALMWKMNAKLDALTAKINVQSKSQVKSTMLDKTADGGNNAKKVGDKVAPSVAPDDDENQVGGKKVYCEFNVTNIKVLTGTGWSFLSAKYHCEKEGGFLATPKSVEDLYQFSRKPRKLFRNPQRNWVGAKENTSGKKNTWVWASGENIPESFIGWLPGGGQGEGCLYYDLGEGGLNNVGCDKKIEGYLCQRC